MINVNSADLDTATSDLVNPTATVTATAISNPTNNGVKNLFDVVVTAMRKAFGVLTPPPAENKSAFHVFKGLDNEWRWFAWVSNKWRDREGEILTDAAHKDYIQFLNAAPERAPELWLWHTPGTAHTNKADWWDYQSGFLMFSGVLTPDEAARYKGDDTPLGMSHGFWKYEQIGQYITKYRTFEVTILPLDRAANAHTAFHIMEAQMTKEFDPRQRAFLVGKLGEAKVAELEADTEKQAAVLEAAGTDWKTLNAEFEATIEAERAQLVQPMVQAIIDEVVKALNLEATFAVISEKLQSLPVLTAQVTALQAEVGALKELDDAKLAKAFAPIAPLDWGFSVQKEAQPETPDVEQLAAAKTYDWLKEL